VICDIKIDQGLAESKIQIAERFICIDHPDDRCRLLSPVLEAPIVQRTYIVAEDLLGFDLEKILRLLDPIRIHLSLVRQLAVREAAVEGKARIRVWSVSSQLRDSAHRPSQSRPSD
jgi:hypothetical protein